MDAERFAALAREGYTRIPLTLQLRADLDTPLSAYLKLADGDDAYLLESVAGGETWGRYSIIGLPAAERVSIADSVFRRHRHGELVEERRVDDPLAEIDRLLAAEKVPQLPDLPPFSGGWVGYFGFETVGYIEPRLRSDRPDRLGTPDILLLLSEEVAVLDNKLGLLHLIVHADPRQPQACAAAQRRLQQLARRLRSAAPSYPEVLDPAQLTEADFVSDFSREDFEAAVRRCQDYILAGDAFQIVLSQRLSVPFQARPVDVYRALRALNPSPYLYFLDFGDLQVVGSSPEILYRVDDGKVVVRPLAGTRPRGASEAEDRALAENLLADPKELAEHLMLIDLGRNDVGRISEAGSVSVPDQMVIERYSHVMHIVSQVEGRLRADLSPMQVLRACFPAGTLSGAPKIRAIEIIQELEPIRRNLYGGAVGYLNWWGESDLAIGIRTAMIKDRQLHVQAGAGIVADSDPATEWEETMNKGRALFRAVAQAAGGL
ncbi:MAG: anthranilate synthase component I [Xanthomonadales bacterium]|nr:anthranilate synthase component I [Xanthomonadales bacterium]MCB1634374.1 anthranilate synthase component I [Xanthomonadales bacterium]